MPSITVGNDITFSYTDSGPPSGSTYTTIFFLHGHTFNSGIFQRLLKIAGSGQLRAIVFDRREYHGTTPYTDDERRVVREGSFEERKRFLQEQGKLIALAVDGLIQALSLPERVAVAGWSLGTTFLLAVYCSINGLSDDVQKRLRKSVKTFILLDVATYTLGMPANPDGYFPLFDDELSQDQAVPALKNWVSSYYQHGDLSSRDIGELKISSRDSDLLRQPTTQTMTSVELESTTSFTSDLKYDSLLIVPDFRLVLEAQTNAFLFDSHVREAWGKHDLWCLYGEATVWTCIYGSWYLEEKKRGSNEMFFKSLPGANHFFMWDYPERTLNLLRNICASDERENSKDLEF